MDRIVATVRRIIRSSAYAPYCASVRVPRIVRRIRSVVVAASRGAADDLVRSSCEVGFAGVHRTTLRVWRPSWPRMDLAERDLAPMSQLSREAMRHDDPQAARWRHSVFWGSGAHARAGACGCNTVSELRLERVDRDRLSASSDPGGIWLASCLVRTRAGGSSLADLAVLSTVRLR